MKTKRRALVLATLGVAGLAAITSTLILDSVGPDGPDTHVRHDATAPPPLAPAAPAVVSAPVVRTLEAPTGRHVFEERLYTPEYPLLRLASRPPAAWLTSPEAVMTSLFSAMQAGDWDWAMSLFDGSDPAWRARVEADRATYLASWPTSFGPHTFTLVKQHVVSVYTLVYTRRADRPSGADADAYPYALRRDDAGRWWLTHELDEHPVKNLPTIEGASREARR